MVAIGFCADSLRINAGKTRLRYGIACWPKPRAAKPACFTKRRRWRARRHLSAQFRGENLFLRPRRSRGLTVSSEPAARGALVGVIGSAEFRPHDALLGQDLKARDVGDERDGA